MRLEFLELGAEPSAARSRFRDRGQLDHSLGAFIDAEPEDSRAAGMWKRAQLVEANAECLAARRGSESCDYIVTDRRHRRPEESQSEMPVLRWHKLARQIPRQRALDLLSRLGCERDANEKAF
jgi:hypothetical protein